MVDFPEPESPVKKIVIGTPYSYKFTASGTPSPTFPVSSGTLPPGLSLNACRPGCCPAPPRPPGSDPLHRPGSQRRLPGGDNPDADDNGQRQWDHRGHLGAGRSAGHPGLH